MKLQDIVETLTPFLNVRYSNIEGTQIKIVATAAPDIELYFLTADIVRHIVTQAQRLVNDVEYPQYSVEICGNAQWEDEPASFMLHITLPADVLEAEGVAALEAYFDSC